MAGTLHDASLVMPAQAAALEQKNESKFRHLVRCFALDLTATQTADRHFASFRERDLPAPARQDRRRVRQQKPEIAGRERAKKTR